MAEKLKIYKYFVNGVEHTAQLNEEDVERYGRDKVTEVKDQAPESKARVTPANK
jgi:hypothetical protein